MKKNILSILFLLQFIFSISVSAGTQAIIKADIVENQDSSKEYIGSKGHFEKNVNGVTAYADAAGSGPVDGTGGSPALTCTRTTSAVISGDGSLLITHPASNVQGQGCSIDFTVGSEAKAKVLQVSFDYLIGSGSFTSGTSSTDSDITVWIYDVTNAQVIQPTTFRIYSSSSSIPDKFIANFQTSYNSTSYRLIFHSGTTVSSSFTLGIDNVKVSQTKIAYGTPISDWKIDSGILLKGQTNDTTFTNQTTTALSRRVGDHLEAKGFVGFSGAPGAGAGNFKIQIPQTIDTSKLGSAVTFNQIVGYAESKQGSVANAFSHGPVYYYGSNYVGITQTGSTAAWSSTAPITWANGDSFSFEFSVPVQGWSSSTQMSQDAGDGRLVNLQLNDGTAITPSGTISTTFAGSSLINFNKTPVKDSINGYSAGSFTIFTPGDYDCYAQLEITHTPSTGATIVTAFAVNGVMKSLTVIKPSSSGNAYPFGKALLTNLKSNDIITVRLFTDVTSPAFPSSTVNNLTILKVDQNSQKIAATESIVARYENTAGTAVGTSYATMVYPTKTRDTHGALNPATGVFTAPANGEYEIAWGYASAAVSLSTAQAFFSQVLYNNTTTIGVDWKSGTGGGSINYTGTGKTSYYLKYGDTLRVQITSSVATSLATGQGFNWVSIKRVGL